MLIHPLVEAQARRAPEAPALAFGGECLNYAELEARANRLARALRRRGVGPEALVGVAAERSVETIVALLAVLKAGGAYVPLDPSYPSERLAFMWGDASRPRPGGAAPVLLTQERTAGAVPAHGAQVLRLDADAALWAGESAEPLPAGEAGVDHDHLAYVIYTSGSTGRPKGVLIAHRGVVNVIRESARLLDVGPESRVLQLASLSFDASVLEIFTALSTGACLVLTRRETLLSGEALGRELAAERITTIAIPPSLLDKVPEGIELPALRSIVVGGEACSAATAARWAPGRRFVNAYAPTEATIFATAGECTGLDPSPPAIGVPIAETEVQLLGADGAPVPPSEPGEICLGGAGVARGYLHRPDLTAERFVPAAGGGRLYRSGDLGRQRPDGSLEFIGRVDFQVKVRGFRIELGEIEAVLGEHPAVRSAVVEARQGGEGGEPSSTEKRLVAYVVPRGAADGLVSALRAHLAERLPDYMVPAAFIFLDALPMAATGKVDRKALPAPDRARPALETAYAAPSGPVEEALARLWGELLGLDRVGARDNLFALGGHSLLVAQIVSRVRQDLGVELPIPAVFEQPTIAALAARIAAARAGGVESDEPELPPVERVPRDRPLPLSFTQERVWFLNQLSPGAIAYNFQFT
ncbi:MAG TPA: amino acid adenylation domain-containing protein, partial [Thermoanaerobaculia bacterium]